MSQNDIKDQEQTQQTETISIDPITPVEEPTPMTEVQANINLGGQDLVDWKEQYLRISAEFENFKRRTNREKEQFFRYAGESVLKAILPIIDDVERTLKASEQTENIQAVRDGMQLVLKNMRFILEKQGLTPLDALNQTFNSDFHEAIASMPVDDEDKKGKVIEEIEKGYQYHDKVIRFARVIVGE